MANSELKTAITAAKENSIPIPNRTQIQPPSGAARMEIRWLMESPVERVDVSSS